MTRHILTLCLVFLCIASSQGQTLRIKSNSVEDLTVVAVGIDKDGKYVSKTIYGFDHDKYTMLSLLEEKYGFDYFHNKEMKNVGLDPNCKWTKLMVYDASNTIYDTIDLTKSDKRIAINNASLWAKVKRRYERDYLITDVVLNDN